MSQTPRGIGGSPLKSVKPAVFAATEISAPLKTPAIVMSREKSDLDPLSAMNVSARPPLPPPPSASKSTFAPSPIKPTQPIADSVSPLVNVNPSVTPQKLHVSTSSVSSNASDTPIRSPTVSGVQHTNHPTLSSSAALPPLPQVTPDQFGREFLAKCHHPVPVSTHENSPLDIPADIDGQMSLLCSIACKRNWRYALSIAERMLRLHEVYINSPKSSAGSSFSNTHSQPVSQIQIQPVHIRTSASSQPLVSDLQTVEVSQNDSNDKLETKIEDNEVVSRDGSYSSTSTDDNVTDLKLIEAKMDEIGVLDSFVPLSQENVNSMDSNDHPVVDGDQLSLNKPVVEHIPTHGDEFVISEQEKILIENVSNAPKEIDLTSRLSTDCGSSYSTYFRILYVKCLCLFKIHSFGLVLNFASDELQKFLTSYLCNRNPDCDKNQIMSFASRIVMLDGKYLNLDSIQSRWVHFIDNRNPLTPIANSVIPVFDFPLDVWLIVAASLINEKDGWVNGVHILCNLKERIDCSIAHHCDATPCPDPLFARHCDGDDGATLWIWRRRVCFALISAYCRVRRWFVAIDLLNQQLLEAQTALKFLDSDCQTMPEAPIMKCLCVCISRQINGHITTDMNKRVLSLILRCSTHVVIIDALCKAVLINYAANSPGNHSSKYISLASGVLNALKTCGLELSNVSDLSNNIRTMLQYCTILIQISSSIVDIRQGSYSSCLRSIGQCFDENIGTAEHVPDLRVNWKNTLKFSPYPSIEIDSNVMQSLSNNYSLADFFSGQLDKSLIMMERLVTSDPYRSFNDGTAFNLCAIYNELHDIVISTVKKKGLYLAASGLGIEDIETRSFQIPEEPIK